MALRPDKDQLAQFLSLLFRHSDEGTYVSLRAFDQFDRGQSAVFIEGVPINGSMERVVARATARADEAANRGRAAVFAPPVATFNNPRTASSADVANGVAISVEVDSGDTAAARRRLEHLLGPATVVMHSGGEWIDPETGEVHPKVHLHWRLSEPTRTRAEHAKLQEARWAAAVLVGGDKTAAPPAHPLRWPGSWNTKRTAKLATIAAGNAASEVHLDDALEKLLDALEASGLGQDARGPKVSGEPQAAIGRVAAALAHIPNADVEWDDWNRMGMAAWRATGGSAEGLEAWQAWSAKSAKHDPGACEGRWNHYGISPPARIGAGTIFHLARVHGWREERPEAEPPPDPDEGWWEAVQRSVTGEAPEEDRQPAREAPAGAPLGEPKASALWVSDDEWSEEDLPKRPWIARGYLIRRSVTLLVGMGAAGKSSVGVAWGCALVLGRQWSRFKPYRPCSVSIYNVEDDDDEQKRRLSAVLRQFQATPRDLVGKLHRIGPHNVGTLIERDPATNRLRFTEAMHDLRAHVEEVRPDVLILDPLVELHNADENDNTALRAVMATLRALAAHYDMSIVLVHHSRKGSGATPGDPDSIRGAGAIVGAARVALTVTTMSEEEAKGMNMPAAQRFGYFRMDGAKQNYAKIEDAEWFQRVEVELANGEGVAAAVPWKPVNVWAQQSTHDLNAVLDAIAAGPTPGDLYAPDKRGKGNTRWVGFLLMRMLDVNEQVAARMVDEWKRNGLLVTVRYENPHREEAQGVRVDPAKRPT